MYLPVAASTITTRRLPYPSDTYSRFVVGSTIRSAGRKKNGVAFLPPSLLLLSAPLVGPPIIITNLPCLVNFRTMPSAPAVEAHADPFGLPLPPLPPMYTNPL